MVKETYMDFMRKHRELYDWDYVPEKDGREIEEEEMDAVMIEA
jgi:hypothetical protein